MTYRTLADIQLEIARLRQEVSAKEDEISNLWNNTFHQTDDKELKTPTQRILQYAKEEKVTNYLKNVINSML